MRDLEFEEDLAVEPEKEEGLEAKLEVIKDLLTAALGKMAEGGEAPMELDPSEAPEVEELTQEEPEEELVTEKDFGTPEKKKIKSMMVVASNKPSPFMGKSPAASLAKVAAKSMPKKGKGRI